VRGIVRTVADAPGSGGWWVSSLVAAAPAVGLAAAAGAVGVAKPIGLGLGALALAWLALDLVLIQPAIDRRQLGAGGGLAQAGRAFLQRALIARSVADIALELEQAARSTLGVDKALLLVPGDQGGVNVLGGDGSEGARLGDAELAFLWLGDRGEPVDRALLGTLSEFEGARAASGLAERLGVDVLLPLRHRGLLLGVAALSSPRRGGDTGSIDTFYRILGAHTTMAVANSYLDREASGKKHLARAMDLATALQEALMPDDRPVRRPGVQLRGMFRPVAECGGDLWTWQDLGGGKILVLIGDATGHGAAPAMLTAVAKGGVDAMRQLAGAHLDPAELLAELNRAVYRAGRTRYLMTAFAAVLDPLAGELRYANAGQNFPYLITRGDGGRVKLEQLVARGNTLGAAPDAPYQALVRKLEPQDRLILYTDGMVDAGSPMAEPFGEKRFRAALVSLADAPAARVAEGLMSEVDAYLSGRAPADDMTVVAIELAAPEEPHAPPVITPLGGGGMFE
jgi:serine phosphatase RsbU (regulator of sigma subunit)